MTEGYDEDPILAQVPVQVLANDDLSSVRERVQVAEKKLLVEWLSAWATTEESTLVAITPGHQ